MSPSSLLDYLVENEPSFRKARLPALYSDFSPKKTLNPDGYAANISAWRRGLSSIVRSGLSPTSAKSKTTSSVFVLNCDEAALARAFESKQYGRPLALGEVLKEMVRSGDLIPLNGFLEGKESIYAKKGWSVWGIGGWVLTKVVGDWSRVPGGEYVVLENVEGVGKKFVEGGMSEVGETRFERVFSKAHFGKVFNDGLSTGVGKTGLGERDMDVLLRFLSRDKGLLVYDGKTVRVGTEEGEGEEITEEDTSIAQLKELLASLGHQIQILEKRVEELNASARLAVAKQNKVGALAALKSKKLAEATLESRFATVSQLEEVAAKIQQAEDNVQIVKVMESSSDALKSLTARTGGVERVEEVVDRLREQMAATDEIGSIMAEASGREAIDEGEIDEEFAELERAEKKKVEEKERKEREVREAKERERKDEEERKEAEAMRRRLEQIGEVPSTRPQHEEDASAEAMMSRLTLKE
ncbi:Snf7-domain-containing protein [Cladorrhinum sp. PSN259]|nr:Snf7-domain-containing protein [Cladorrhinum sp. PSN259]